MPTLILRRIRLSLRNKIGICFLMGLGLLLVVAIAILDLSSNQRVDEEGN